MINTPVLDQVFDHIMNADLFEEISELLGAVMTHGTGTGKSVGYKSARETNVSSLASLFSKNANTVHNILRRLLWTQKIFIENSGGTYLLWM